MHRPRGTLVFRWSASSDGSLGGRRRDRSRGAAPPGAHHGRRRGMARRGGPCEGARGRLDHRCWSVGRGAAPFRRRAPRRGRARAASPPGSLYKSAPGRRELAGCRSRGLHPATSRFADRRAGLSSSTSSSPTTSRSRGEQRACMRPAREPPLREGDPPHGLARPAPRSQCGLDPHGARLITFAREFAHNLRVLRRVEPRRRARRALGESTGRSLRRCPSAPKSSTSAPRSRCRPRPTIDASSSSLGGDDDLRSRRAGRRIAAAPRPSLSDSRPGVGQDGHGSGGSLRRSRRRRTWSRWPAARRISPSPTSART